MIREVLCDNKVRMCLQPKGYGLPARMEIRMIDARQHGYFKIHGVSIHYRIYGTGKKTLFFLHGNGEDWTCFDKQIPFLAKDYKVVVMDSRGHGKSGVNEKSLSIKQMARDTAVMIKKLQLTNVTLVGFSDGGNIVLEMMVNDLVEVEGIVIAGANLNPRGIKMQYQFPIILGHAFCELLAWRNDKMRLKADILGLMTHEPNMRPEQLKRLNIPALVLAGEKDMVKTKHTKKIALALPESTLVIIPGADHFVFQKQSERVNTLIKKFVNSY